MNRIAIASQKGGVAKTTTTANLACALAEKDQKVLVVDIDPQFALTRAFGHTVTAGEVTIGEILMGQGTVDQAAIDLGSGVSLISAKRDLRATEREVQKELRREFRLADALDNAERTFDYVLIDCPPYMGDLVVNALVAARHVIVPVKMTDAYSLQGAGEMVRAVETLAAANLAVEIIGFLPTFSRPSRRAYQALAPALAQLGPVSKSEIPWLAELEDAAFSPPPMFWKNPDARTSCAYRDLANEVIESGVASWQATV